MNLRRTPLLPPQGLDIAPMSPPTFPAPQGGGGSAGPSGMDLLAGLAQQYHAGQMEKQAGQVRKVQNTETDSPLLRRKPLFEDLMGAAMGGANA